MNDSTLAAAHGIEMERHASAFDLVGGGEGAQAQLFDPQDAVVVRVEGNKRVVFGGNAQGLGGQMLQGQQQFSAVGEQQVDIGSGKFNSDFRVLDFRVRIFGGLQLVGKLEAGVFEHWREKLLQLRLQRVDSVFHAYFFTVFLTGALEGGGAGGGTGAGMSLLMTSC